MMEAPKRVGVTNMKQLLFLPVLAVLLTGCLADMGLSIGITVLDGAVEAKTGKNIADTLLSETMEEDCELKNVFKEGEPICKGDNKDGGRDGNKK